MGLPAIRGAAAITYKWACPLTRQGGRGPPIVGSARFVAVGTGLILHVRQVMRREVRQARAVMDAARSALLRPLPARIDGLATAAAQLSTDRGASVGGDLYAVIATEHGVRRVVMGDVRGHGLGAIGTVAAVLGSFREAVHDETELAGVLARLDRALARHLRDRAGDTEDFVTVLLLQITPDGELHALNCGPPDPTCSAPTERHRSPAPIPCPRWARAFRSLGRAPWRNPYEVAPSLPSPKDDIAILVLRNDRVLGRASASRGAGNRAINPHLPTADKPPAAPAP